MAGKLNTEKILHPINNNKFRSMDPFRILRKECEKKLKFSGKGDDKGFNEA
jgi:hypothetical protein